MKKFAIGCAIVLVIGLIGAAAASYFIFNKVRSTVAEFAVLAELPEIERGVRNTSAFTPPESGELTEVQVGRLLEVQGRIRSLLGTRFGEFETKYAELTRRMDEHKGTVLDAPAVINAYRDLATLYVDAKKAQVTSLNDAGMSLAEYTWVRGQAYAALGVPMAAADISKIIQAAAAGRDGDGGAGSDQSPHASAGPESNKALVEPHRKALEDNVALGFFGL